MSSASVWNREEDKAFENAIALHWIDEHEDSNEQWDKIASMVPSKTMEELKQHYQMLVEDVRSIESGNTPIPNYGGEEATTSLSKDSSSTRASSGASASDKRLNCGHGNGGGGFSTLGHDSSGHGSKGGSRSDQERKKGIPWTEEEHRYMNLALSLLSDVSLAQKEGNLKLIILGQVRFTNKNPSSSFFNKSKTHELIF